MSEAATAQACTICLTELTEGDDACACPACSACYHRECWEENAGCGVYGCASAPAVEPRGALEVPVSHWGQEHKLCPSCGARIAAAAVRCRQCGAAFSTANPQDVGSFREKSEQAARLPGARKMTLAIFICSIVPCLAPIGVPFGALWWLVRRRDVAALPAFNGAILKIGLGIGLVEIIAIVVVSVLRGVMGGA
jgi:hypothetical protein